MGRFAKESRPALAFIHFRSIPDMLNFYKHFDGHLFVDSRGKESRASVELAPYQKIPKKRRKQDYRDNTIEADSEYKAFVETLKNATGNAVELELEKMKLEGS